MSEIAWCPWCTMPVIEHLIVATEPATEERPGRRIYHCAAAPPLTEPILVEPAA